MSEFAHKRFCSFAFLHVDAAAHFLRVASLTGTLADIELDWVQVLSRCRSAQHWKALGRPWKRCLTFSNVDFIFDFELQNPKQATLEQKVVAQCQWFNSEATENSNRKTENNTSTSTTKNNPTPKQKHFSKPCFLLHVCFTSSIPETSAMAFLTTLLLASVYRAACSKYWWCLVYSSGLAGGKTERRLKLTGFLKPVLKLSTAFTAFEMRFSQDQFFLFILFQLLFTLPNKK